MFGVLAALAIPSHAESRPRWCAGLSGDHFDVTGIQVIREGKQPGIVLKQIVDTMCKGPDRGQMGELEAVRQQWMKRFNMTEADWPDVVEFSMLSQSDRQNGYRTKGGGEYFAGKGDPATLDALGSKLTERDRLGYIDWCLHNNQPADWAICQGDIEAFDRARFAAELRADRSMSGAAKMYLRMSLDGLPHTFEVHADKVEHEARFNPHIDELLALGEATRKAWPERQRVLAAARDRGPGCGEPTLTAWKGVVPAGTSAIDNSIDGALAAIVATPDGYVASLALASCKENRDSLPELVDGIHAAIARYGVPIGPRTAVEIAVRARGFQSSNREPPQAKSQWGAAESGTIQKLATHRDGVAITFKKVITSAKECLATRETRKVYRVHEDGTLEYQSVCTKSGIVKHDLTPAPVTVVGPLAARLKVGMDIDVVGRIPFRTRSQHGDEVDLTLFGVPVSMSSVADHSETVAPSATAGGNHARRAASRRVAGRSQLQ